jgi:hypothetical protein
LSKVQRLMMWAVGMASIGLIAILGAANLYFGDLNQDEGWYLYAARLVSQGDLPYRDFAFTQAPVLPFVYALAQSWMDHWGLAGGRLFSWVLGFLSALAAAGIAARLALPGRRLLSALVAFALIAGNVYQSYFTTVVKTYALCAFFLSTGLLALTYCRRSGLLTFLSGVLLVLAGGSRISAGGVAAVAFCFLFWQARKIGWRPFMAFAAGSILTAAVVFIPLFLAAPEGFLFGVIQYHSGRTAGSLMQTLVFKAGFVSRLVQAYFWPIAVAVMLLAWRWINVSVATALRCREEERPNGVGRLQFFPSLIWTALALVTLVHFSAPVPYEDYQVMLFPIFCAALAPAMVRVVCMTENSIVEPRRANWLLTVMLIVSVMSAFSSPINQSWFIQGRDRIWWKMKEQPDLRRLQEVASWINEVLPPGELILTQDTYLAVEAGLTVPRGMEMGPFSYFPAFDRTKADTLHVLNRESMLELLKTTPARMAAFSGYGLSIYSPEVQEIAEEDQAAFWAVVDSRYAHVMDIPSFGQGHTVLKILMATHSMDEVLDKP